MIRLLSSLLLLVAVIVACDVSEDQVQQAELDIADAPVEVRVTATRMYEDYESNKIAANQTYDGKVLEISGMISDFGGGTQGDSHYVDLDTGDFSFTTVRCHFSQAHLDAMVSLAAGDRVTLRGRGDEKEDRNPFTIDVVGCSLVSEG